MKTTLDTSEFKIVDGVVTKIPADTKKRNPNRWIPFEDRLFAKRRITEDGHWEFTGFISKEGSGQIYYKQKVMTIQRAAYLHFIGPIEDRGRIYHTCGQTNCFNPEHLAVNSKRKYTKREPYGYR